MPTGDDTPVARGPRQNCFWMVGEALMVLFHDLETRDKRVKML